MTSFNERYRFGYLAATPKGRLNGKRVYSVPVRVSCNGEFQADLLRLEPRRTWRTVIAHNATEAANFVRDSEDWPANTEILAIGPKGGEVERFIGWPSWVERQITGKYRAPLQLRIDSDLNRPV